MNGMTAIKILRLATTAMIVASVLSLFVAIEKSNHILKVTHPSIPTPENPIALSVRGMGTIYLTQSEWDAISPYWSTFYLCLSLVGASLVGNFAYRMYQRKSGSEDRLRRR